MKQFADIYRNKRVLVTGHTGFKGSWLTLWLQKLGAEVTGVALSPEYQTNHWEMIKPSIDDRRIDIREISKLQNVIEEKKPEIVFHLAAQPLVRKSYRNPIETWSTNVMGTVNLLEICQNQSGVGAIVTITTDKCYENLEWPWGYRENDRLGGGDPYSASKAAVELVVESYRKSYPQRNESLLMATARAGNVIGGGDWSEDRLVPDLMRALKKKESVEIRFPGATRPWQHVLDSLSGYLLLGQKLLMGDKTFAEAWNFGPNQESNRTVLEVIERLQKHLVDIRWHDAEKQQLYESRLLYLDSSKALKRLHWSPVWNIDVALEKTAVWYQAWLKNGQAITREQLADYIESAHQANLEWIDL